MNPRSIAVIASVLIPLCGCSGVRPRPKPGEGTRLAVPYVSDRREQWGPAAVADVLQFQGRSVDAKTLRSIRREVRFTRKPEDVARDLENAGRSLGFEAELVKADLPAIKRELDEGRPVIVVVNTGFSWAPVRGYMVVTGYSDHRRCVYAHWGPMKDHFVSYRQLQADWKKSGNWLLRIEGTETVARADAPPAAPTPPPAPKPAALKPYPFSPRPPAPEVEPPDPAEDSKLPDFIWFSP
jgi:hypothetical protein